MPTFVLPLVIPNATLGVIGGKEMSLAKIARTGIPVRDGFYVTTKAYRCYVAENVLWLRIEDALGSASSADTVYIVDPAQLNEMEGVI